MMHEKTNMNAFVRNSYADLLLYYRTIGVGKKSDVAGVIVTERLIETIERRYTRLGGDIIRLYAEIPLPSKNGKKTTTK
jgi:vacuolar-type H+-ATPase subunit F/Vma7